MPDVAPAGNVGIETRINEAVHDEGSDARSWFPANTPLIPVLRLTAHMGGQFLMCEQTEINYLDGDVVWVKLGACWWPGQVTGFHNLPEDIQHEFKKKPLIAAVKFFQEDTYEFVKNYQQIYKYNCTLKDDFIKKGLDKYRSKTKDGSRYMDKFPGDIEMAEKLTGGDPDILNDDKFSPEEKPNISALFGEKKIPKKKRERDDMHRRSDGHESARKITHPRFLKESDHEVRIRQQPSSLPSTPNSTGSPQYPCHLCSFTSSRVNVIICHIKSHRSGGTPSARSKVKSYTQHKSRISDTETPKRKYVRKEKSHSNKSKASSESGKRKQTKQTEKASKKKKTDPKIRDTILADWDDESDEDVSLNQNTSLDLNSTNSSPTKSQSDFDRTEESDQMNSTTTDSNKIIEETEKLLQETEKLTSLDIIDDALNSNVRASTNLKASVSDKKLESEKDANNESTNKLQKEKDVTVSDNGSKRTPGKDDKKALLSCFDFHEEEPSIPPVRKKGRAFHQKKEIIKEFEMSQALRTEQEKEIDSRKAGESAESDVNRKNHEKLVDSVEDSAEIKKNDSTTNRSQQSNSKDIKTDNKAKAKTPSKGESQKSNNACDTELEIVEIFEVEREEGEHENAKQSTKNIKKELQGSIKADMLDNISKAATENKSHSESQSENNEEMKSKGALTESPIMDSTEHTLTKDMDESLSERFTTETEDETVSESAETLPEQSENSDLEMIDLDQVPNTGAIGVSLNSQKLNVTPKVVKKRRGRPRKNAEAAQSSTSKSADAKIKDNINQKLFEKVGMERKTSESDSDRSYSGRKRKPNKKYLESEIYVQERDHRMSRTDESQSESDDKGTEKLRGASRRSRRSTGTGKKKTEVIEDKEEKELEVSRKISDATENNISKAASKDDTNDSNICKDKTSIEIDARLIDTEAPFNTSALIEQSEGEEYGMNESEMLVQSEDIKLPVRGDSATKPSTPAVETEKINDKEVESKHVLNQDKEVQEDSKSKLLLSTESLSSFQLEVSSEKEESHLPLDTSKSSLDILPPKKSQIKKFGLSLVDFFESDISANKIAVESEKRVEKSEEISAGILKTDAKEEIVETGSEKKLIPKSPKGDTVVEDAMKDLHADQKNIESSKQTLSTNEENIDHAEMKTPEQQPSEVKATSSDESIKDATTASTDTLNEQQVLKRSSMQTRYKGKFTPETGAKSKKDKDLFSEEKSTNTFQEAFLKTLHMDKKRSATDDLEMSVGKGKKTKKIAKKKVEEENATVTSVPTQEAKTEVTTDKSGTPETTANIQIQEHDSQVSLMSNFEGIEVVVDQNIEIETKVGDPMFQNVDELASSSAEFGIISKPLTQSSSTEDSSKSITLDAQKLNESLRAAVSTPSPSCDVTVPVKKREMPRIIENVTLTEPMQILKSKLLDKLPQKGVKHKLETESTKKGDQKGSPKAKIMKIESLSPNSKMKTGAKVTSPRLSLTKKLQVLKAEEAETAAIIEAQNEQFNVKASKTSTTRTTEKYIQQSSQSLADMELDINSMPFVLSEDVLTPENIEQMPVVISSIIPASSTIPATLSFTPTTQIVSPTQTQFKLTNEGASELSPTKKKSGTPAILKNKSKAKPTITSIKTIVPPLTGGVKGIKFQSSPVNKTPPLLTQKGTSGKYVVVQTSGGQQLRYSVQGKAGTQQKIAIPTGKTTGNAQVVQQGGKVVILTSAQSGQTKMLPLNLSKTLSGKVQRIMTNKGQVFCPISPQSIITSKAIIAPKGDGVSPTTSKIAPSHKIINTQGIIMSKGVLTPIPGTIAKTALLGTLSQGILTKDGIYTPISASALGGKTNIGSKTLVTKAATILSSQNLGPSKAILTPISQTIGGKTILSTQGIVSTKATVLTPITGQQVKAIAAKSPTKASKVQYQSVQQKVQLPLLQKSQKISMASSPGRSGQHKASSSTVMLQNAAIAQKGLQQGKKIIKQTIVQQGATIQNISSQTGTQQTVGIVPQTQHKGKAASSPIVQKVIVPRGGRQSKTQQQKIVVQKVQEPAITTVQGIQSKAFSMPPTTVPSISKMVTQQKHAGSSTTTMKATTKGHATNKTAQHQKKLSNVAMNSGTTTNVNTNLSTSLSLPPLEPIELEKKSNVLVEPVQKEQSKVEKFNVEKSAEAEKIEETKITAQPQIMALPTESSDGTQTYVLVTIDEQGQIQPLDNNTLMSLEGTTQNPDGTRTLYIDPSSLGEAGTLDNIVLQFDNGVLPNIQTSTTESTQAIISESFPTSEVIQTSNQDILAAALANTDFQQEISLPENPAGSVMTAGLTQTSLINQTILQSTIIPPTEPISSPSVLETSLTLNQPIMTPLEVPSNLPIQSESTPISAVTTIPTSLELPITITNPNISYIAAGEAQIQIPGNSMPDIGEIMETPAATEISRSEIPASSQYLVLPNLEDNITVDTQNVQSGDISMPSVSYSVSIPNNIVLETPQVQTTPSMPIIDDTYSESVQFTTSMESSLGTEQTFVDVPVSEMLVSKASISAESVPAQDVTVTSEMIISRDVPVSSEEPIVSTNEPSILSEEHDNATPLQEVYSSGEVPVTSEELILQNATAKEDNASNVAVAAAGKNEEATSKDDTVQLHIAEQTDEPMTSSMPIIDESSLVTSKSNLKISPVEPMSFEVSDSNEIETGTSQESKSIDKFKLDSPMIEEQAATSNEVEVAQETSEILPAESLNRLDEQSMDVEPLESNTYPASTIKQPEESQRDEPSSQGVSSDLVEKNLELDFEETNAETSHETPSQSYEQFGISMTTDSSDLPSQSATKSENSREPSQSITYEPMETDEEAIATEPPTQSFEHSEINEASQSYETSAEASTNAPTQSFNELMQSQEERPIIDETVDDQTFPTQSYEVGKAENISENLETDAEISQEGNIPSQSNDIGTDGIGTSSVFTNNSGLNEDETASSSYVPETPENQERDQDQESAISTSSYEIPPCEELNIASSSVIPDTSVRAEHTSIHDNGVPEIPTSSYNLNPDITSTHVDSVPTSSYEDQVIVEQNVSTSYEVPISMPGLEETCSQNFVTESTDHRNEPSSYYTHHQEVTASYYESVDQETNSRLEADPQEEVTPSYYEGNPQEASQSYFTPEEATPSYSPHNVSPSYYDPRPESEASQSYYSTDDIEKTEQSSSQNIEASQSFYQEQSDELKLRQQGEATPTYTERYPVDYTLDNSPIERHDLVESSVPATRPTER